MDPEVEVELKGGMKGERSSGSKRNVKVEVE